MIDREHFSLVFKGDIGKFERNPMNTETPFGRTVAAGRGDAFAARDRLESMIEWMENLDPDLVAAARVRFSLMLE